MLTKSAGFCSFISDFPCHSLPKVNPYRWQTISHETAEILATHVTGSRVVVKGEYDGTFYMNCTCDVYGWMHACMDGCMDGWMDGWMDRLIGK